MLRTNCSWFALGLALIAFMFAAPTAGSAQTTMESLQTQMETPLLTLAVQDSITSIYRVAIPAREREQVLAGLSHQLPSAVVASNPGSSTDIVSVTIANGHTATDSARNVTPTGVALEQNFPNPAPEHTTIGFRIAHAGHVTLRLFDRKGVEQATLINSEQAAGYHSFDFDTFLLPSGTYRYVLEMEGAMVSRTLQIIR